MTSSASAITATSATLNGSVNPNGTQTSFYFQWGLNTNYENRTASQDLGNVSALIAVASTIIDLAPGAIYHYRLVAEASGQIVFGDDQTFTSLFRAPAAITGPAISVTTNAAVLSGNINPNGARTSVFFQYGLSTSYGNSTIGLDAGNGTNNVTLSAFLTGLLPTRSYHYRVVATNVAGQSLGADRTFVTVPPPTVVTMAASGVSNNMATLNGSVNPNGTGTSVFFQWGTTLDYGQNSATQSMGQTTSPVPVSVVATGLVGRTNYHFRVVAITVNGLTVYGEDQSFETPATAPFAVTLPPTSLGPLGVSLSGLATANGIATTASFQFGTTTNFGSTTTASDIGDGSNPVTVSFSVTNLVPSSVYYFRLTASNKLGTAYGKIERWATPSPAMGTALSFDGTNSSLIIPEGGGLNAANQGTIEMWVRWDGPQAAGAIGAGYIVSRQADFSFSNDIIGLSTSNPNDARIIWLPFSTGTPVITGATKVGDGLWHHVAITFGVGSHKLYLDGVLDGTGTATGALSDNNKVALTIGGWSVSGKLAGIRGVLDEVRVWNTVRSAAEIQANMRRPLTGAEPGLVTYLRLDDGFGIMARDASPNKHDGVLTNGPLWVPSTASAFAGSIPGVASGNATEILSRSATLNGQVHPNGSDTAAYFEWGPTLNYGSVTPLQALGTGTNFVAITQKLTNLFSGADYNYRVVAYNEKGTNYGNNRNFITLGGSGTALSFSGSQNYVNIPGGGGLNGAAQGTIEMWVRWDGIQPPSLTGFGFVLGRQADFFFSNNLIGLNSSNPATASVTWAPFGFAPLITGSSKVGSGVWRHVAVTFAGGTHKLYLDGILDGAAFSTGTLADNISIPLTVGAWLQNGKVNGNIQGQLDDLRIWNIARSEDEIRATMRTRLQGNELGLITYLAFDEAKGSIASDVSGHGHDGALIENPLWVVSGAFGSDILIPKVLLPSVTNLTTSTATLLGFVDPSGLDSVAFFEWGDTSAARIQTARQLVSSQAQDFPVAAQLSGLTPGLYFYRLTASNSQGTIRSPTFTFAVHSSDAGFALAFNGVSDAVIVPGGAGLNAAVQGTVEMWVRWDGPQPAGAVGFGPVLARQQDFAFSNDIITLSSQDPNTAKVLWLPFNFSQSISGTTMVGSGTWRHLAVTFNQISHRIYLDGVLDGSGVVTGAMNNGAEVPLTIGTWIVSGIPNGIRGAIDEVRIWNIERTQDAIKATMKQRLIGNEPGLLTYLRFDEGSLGVANDTTGRGNMGTLIGNPTWTGSSAPLNLGMPPDIRSIFSLGDSRFRIRLRVVPNQSHYLQGSGDLVTWTSIGSVSVGPGGTFEIDDAPPSNLPMRYYRTISAP